MYVFKEDIIDKDGLYFFVIFFFMILGLILVGVGVRKVVILMVDDDVIEVKLVMGGKFELKVNNYKLDECIDYVVKFKVGRDESRIVEIKLIRIKWNVFGWVFYVDD